MARQDSERRLAELRAQSRRLRRVIQKLHEEDRRREHDDAPRRHSRRQLHPEVNAAIHLAAGIFWTTGAYTARAAYWGLSSLEFLPRWGLDYSVWLDVGCNLVFAYGCWRAHQAIFLRSPKDSRGARPSHGRRSTTFTPACPTRSPP